MPGPSDFIPPYRRKPVSLYAAFLLAVIFLLCGASAAAETRNLPFRRGVNLSQWFERRSAGAVQPDLFTLETFQNLRGMGADTVRLPIHFENLAEEKENWTIGEDVFRMIDRAVDFAEETGMYIILDNHSFDPHAATPRDIQKRLEKIWTQVASRYKTRSSLVLYEILNEPHGISLSRWADIQGEIIRAIRAVDPDRMLVVGGADWNSISAMEKLPDYGDENLVYTFHFYDPYLFTHQGGSWTDIPDIAGIPFPYARENMPDLSRRQRQQAGAMLQNYPRDGTPEAMARTLDRVKVFAEKRNARVFCGEFGVYMLHADPNDRAYWYKTARTLLEERGISWTMWDYFGGFGLFRSEEGGIYPGGINREIALAAGFTPADAPYSGPPPVQLPFILQSGDSGIQAGIRLEDNWTGGELLANADDGSGGKAVVLRNCARYGSISFRFPGGLDLSAAAESGVLEFRVRTEGRPGKIQIRFENPQDISTEPPQIPWRMGADWNADADAAAGSGGITVSAPDAAGFRTVRVPLSAMQETGAWVSGEERWMEPEAGAFDWKHVAGLKFTAEYGPLENSALFIRDAVIR